MYTGIDRMRLQDNKDALETITGIYSRQGEIIPFDKEIT